MAVARGLAAFQKARFTTSYFRGCTSVQDHASGHARGGARGRRSEGDGCKADRPEASHGISMKRCKRRGSMRAKNILFIVWMESRSGNPKGQEKRARVRGDARSRVQEVVVVQLVVVRRHLPLDLRGVYPGDEVLEVPRHQVGRVAYRLWSNPHVPLLDERDGLA